MFLQLKNIRDKKQNGWICKIADFFLSSVSFFASYSSSKRVHFRHAPSKQKQKARVPVNPIPKKNENKAVSWP